MPPAYIRTFRLDPTAFESTTKRRVYRRLAWGVPFTVLLLTFQLAFMSRMPGVGEALPVTVPVIVMALGFGMLRAVRLQLKNGKPTWGSYELTVSENVIRRQVLNLPTVEILRPEVTRLADVPGEGLTITAGDRHHMLFVPEQLVGYSEVRDHLAAWKAPEPPKFVQSRAAVVAWSALLIGSWVGTGVIRDIRLAMVSGVVLLVVGVLTIRETLENNAIENKVKAVTIGGLGFMLIAPIARLLLHFVFQANMGWPQ